MQYVLNFYHFTKKNSELAIFFFFLTISLFLGDGKQPFVDIWWALGILTMYGIRYYQRGRLDLRLLPRLIGFAWTTLILYYIVVTFFSDSVGYSITATVRLIEAYLLFVLFYTISSERLITLFTKGLIAVSVVAILASWIFIAFPSLAGFLPLMNLLYASYGHNHLADLLLPIFPLIIAQVQHKPSRWSWFLLFFYTAGTILTFARGAWLILIGYFVFVWTKNRKEKSPHFRILLLVVALVLVVVFSGISIYSSKLGSNETRPSWLPPSISRLIMKPSLQEDGRFEYWRQALIAIRERPWFGSGPGTFYLESKRLQAAPSSYSWFAHSFSLQTLVELGVVGFTIFVTVKLFILLSIWHRVHIKHSSENYLSLAIGAALTILYGLYEFNLDYALIFLILWATFGILTGAHTQYDRYRFVTFQQTTVAISLIFLASYYGTYIGSVIRPILAPYRADLIEKYIYEIDGKLSREQKVFIEYFHHKNSEVLFAMTRGTSTKLSIPYIDILAADPKNWDYYREYFKYLKDNGTLRDRMQLLLLLTRNILPREFVFDFRELDLLGKNTPEALDAKLSLLDESSNMKEALQKIYYFAGLDLLPTDPIVTRRFWTIARDIFPNWGYYHMELAALMRYQFNDKEEAKHVLDECQKFDYARLWCSQTSVNDIPPVGSSQKNIRAIPEILP